MIIPRRRLAELSCAAIALFIAACSAASKSFTFSDGGSGDTGTSAGGAGGSTSSGSSSDDAVSVGISVGASGGPVDDCSEAAKLIYVVGVTYDLYSYHPPTKQFKAIGFINCPAGGATPFSMAVDRTGTAWVLHSNGQIFFVNTTTAACSPSGYQPNQAGFSTFGMGFVSDAPGSKEETLYVGNYFGGNLGKIDKATLKLTEVGDYKNGPNTAAEITGTGDARLYGFFNNGNTTNVAQIDKNDATILSNAQPAGVSVGGGWAFAFWGGSFYLFTAPGFDSSVTKFTPDPLDPNKGTVNIEVQSAGFTIVGAGVSTCAPVEPPT